MANLKQLLSLDEDCISILKEQDNKSEYVRKAIKHFEITKNQEQRPKPTVFRAKEVKI